MKWIWFALWFILIAITATAHSVSERTGSELLDVSACLNFPEEKRIECYSELCSPSYNCAESLIKSATEIDATTGLSVLSELVDINKFSIRSDGHELAHVIGRQTAKHLGLSGKSFLSCPSDFNYGCQHGFFEHVLTQADTSSDAATIICENLPATLPPKDKFYCYHGSGHGIMMASAYDIYETLSVCDSLPSPSAAEGCWQGAFMENVNGEMFGDVRENIFLEDDPLAPCNSFDKKYQWQCYINHAAYLVRFHGGSLRDAAASCLNAANEVIPACMQGLALMTTNPGWQKVLSRNSDGEFINTAVELCDEFPQDYIGECFFGAVDNLLNFDGLKIDRAISFCTLLSPSDQNECYERIGLDLNGLVTSNEQKLETCSKVPEEFRENCAGNRVVRTENFIAMQESEETQELQEQEQLQPKLIKRIEILNTLIFNRLVFDFLTFSIIREKITEIFDRPDAELDVDITLGKKQVMSKEFDSVLIMSDDDFAKDAIRKFSLNSVVESLRRTSYGRGIDCHNRAHEVGRMAYEIVDDSAFRECGIQCHSGCRHGATEAFFAEKGTANLAQNLNLLCNEALNGFNTHQCIHGIGHGLMAWTDYELPEALESCDLLASQAAQSSCYTGVFMENIVGGLSSDEESVFGHFTEYLNEDPQYPCNILDAKYKSECYFLQSDRMLDLTRNFAKVAEECNKAPAQYHRSCFESMGRTVSGNRARDPEKSIATCQAIPNKEQADYCIIGALQDQLWDESQGPNAIIFCELLKGTELEDRCYRQIIQRSADVIQTADGKSSFCANLPLAYQKDCFSSVPSSTEAYEAPLQVESISDADEPTPSSADEAVIRYTDGEFTPKKVTISVGQTVTWINDYDDHFWPASNIHPTHKIYSEFDSKKPLAPGTSWSFTFTREGIWRFHDHWNPRETGTVIVE